jgi:outer membrane protein TolC
MRCATVLLALLAALPAQAARYTLAQLIAKVRAEYPGVLAAKQAVEVARAQETQAARQWAPSGSLDGYLFSTGKSQCFPLTGDPSPDRATREHNCYHFGLLQTLSSGNNIADALPAWGVMVGFNLFLSQPIYSFGRIEAAIQNGHIAVDAARELLRVATDDAVLNATKAYWGVKAARAARDTLGDVHDKLEEWIGRIIKEMEGANKSGYTEADLARLKTALDQVRIYQLDVQRNLVYAEEGLRVLTDDTQADVDGEELSLLDFVPKPLDYYEDAARVHRPEAKLMAATLRGATGLRLARRADLMPELTLQTRANFSYQGPFVDSPHNAFMWRPTAGNVTWNLWLHLPLDLAQRAFSLKRARSDEALMAARRKESLGNWGADVARAFCDHEEARRREERLGHAEKVARGWYTIVDQNMSQGLSASTDARELTDAARIYFDYRIRRLQAIMDANVTWAALERATGLAEK